ncbi:MAG: hypothetical protein PHS31_09925 [Victivallaceae bacterium]|nr:hypothetical protein [Victivallaceae bacterium]
MLQNDYNSLELRDKMLEEMLALLWRQWCELGVQGYTERNGQNVIDPEALLLATCVFGRYEIRLFDQMLDWLTFYHKIININRLKSVIKKFPEDVRSIMAAVCETTGRVSKDKKWLNLGEGFSKDTFNPKRLLFLSEGAVSWEEHSCDEAFAKHGWLRKPIEHRELIGKYQLDAPAVFRIKMRYLFGINTRAEIMVYLASHRAGGYPTNIAREIECSQKNVNDTLVEMASSGFFELNNDGYRKSYRLSEKLSQHLNDIPTWLNWMPVICFLSHLWEKLDDPGFLHLSSNSKSIEIRMMLKKHPYPVKFFAPVDVFPNGIQLNDVNLSNSVFGLADNLLKYIVQ